MSELDKRDRISARENEVDDRRMKVLVIFSTGGEIHSLEGTASSIELELSPARNDVVFFNPMLAPEQFEHVLTVHFTDEVIERLIRNENH